MSKNDKSSVDYKIIYQLNLNSKSLGLVNPYLFVEKLRDIITLMMPNVNVKINYNSKGNKHLVQVKCFLCKNISSCQINNVKKEIESIGTHLHCDLVNRIKEAKRAIA